MEWVDGESEGCFLPLLADELIGSEAFESFESFGEVVGHEEGLQVFLELLMGLIVEAFDGGILERPVHVLDLPVGPGMFGFGAAVFNGILLAGPGKGMDAEEDGFLIAQQIVGK